MDIVRGLADRTEATLESLQRSLFSQLDSLQRFFSNELNSEENLRLFAELPFPQPAQPPHHLLCLPCWRARVGTVSHITFNDIADELPLAMAYQLVQFLLSKPFGVRRLLDDMIRMQTASSTSALLQYPAHIFSLDFDVHMVPPFLLFLVASLYTKASPGELSEPKLHIALLCIAVLQAVLRLTYDTHKVAIHNWATTVANAVRDRAEGFRGSESVQDAKTLLGMAEKERKD